MAKLASAVSNIAISNSTYSFSSNEQIFTANEGQTHDVYQWLMHKNNQTVINADGPRPENMIGHINGWIKMILKVYDLMITKVE